MDFLSGTGRRVVVALDLGENVPVLYVLLVYCVVRAGLFGWQIVCLAGNIVLFWLGQCLLLLFPAS